MSAYSLMEVAHPSTGIDGTPAHTPALSAPFKPSYDASQHTTLRKQQHAAKGPQTG